MPLTSAPLSIDHAAHADVDPGTDAGFIKACQRGDRADVMGALKTGGITPWAQGEGFKEACAHGHEPLVREMMPQVESSLESSAKHMALRGAAENGHADVVECIMGRWLLNTDKAFEMAFLLNHHASARLLAPRANVAVVMERLVGILETPDGERWKADGLVDYLSDAQCEWCETLGVNMAMVLPKCHARLASLRLTSALASEQPAGPPVQPRSPRL